MMSGEKVLRALSMGCAILMVLSGLAMFAGADKDDEKVRCIVLFKDKVDTQLIEDNNGDVLDTFTLIPGAVAEMTKSDMKALEKSDKVKAVEEDSEASICDDTADDAKAPGTKPTPTPTQPDEVVQWGVKQINSDDVWGTNTGSAIKVAVVDTGIDTNHPDLVDNIKGGTNTINPAKSYEDDNGHGTHCAGIIAAVDNTIGVVGVAPEVHLYAVKVLNSRGSGTYTDIIEGIQWCVDNEMQVISMSFGGSASTTGLKDACDAAQAAGIVLVAAAGNEGGAIIYPAAYVSVIAVGATDGNNNVPYWSNYGSELDLVAPGVSIRSTYKGDTYKTLSGTSMACPHVAGTAALVLKDAIPIGYDADGNGQWNPTEVQNCLQSTAKNLGAAGWDKYTGYGLVDAYAAVAA